MQNTTLISNVVQYNRDKFFCLKNDIYFEKKPEFEKILNSRYHKISRVKKRLLFLIIRYQYIWFCTFTINDNFITKSERTKRDYIKQFLNSHDFKYILNVDFGTKGTERQHYHCILATNINMDVNQYFQSMLNIDYGWTKSLLCLKGCDDMVRLSKYIDKLSNHCIKATTQQKRLFYNFKGYDAFCPTPSDATLQYKLERDYFKIIVPLLDKGDITGNFGG